jgi:hypothetical protein
MAGRKERGALPPHGRWRTLRTPSPRTEHVRELIGTDLPPDELERLARVDRLLRAAVRARPALRLVEPPAASVPDRPNLELRLGFRELALIYRSLQAVRTLGAPPLEDELLDDTIELVNRAMQRAI